MSKSLSNVCKSVKKQKKKDNRVIDLLLDKNIYNHFGITDYKNKWIISENIIYSNRYVIIYKSNRNRCFNFYKYVAKISKLRVNEIDIHNKLKHKNIVRLHDYFCNTSGMVLFMDYCGCDLFDYYKKNELSNNEISEIFKQLVKAINYMHNKNIYHQDIKLENILIYKKYKGKIYIKVCDFGFSTDRCFSSNIHGTISYYAPEVSNGLTYSCEKYDVWMIGIVLYCLLFKQFPFEGETRYEIHNSIKNGYRLSNNIDLNLFFKRLLNKIPNKRPRVKDILKSNIFNIISSKTNKIKLLE
tara:strand:- start:210 stop:1106 length:897 start_codon:yes stop_codon:yes gene_type:complete